MIGDHIFTASQFVIRRLRAADAPAFRTLRLRALAEHPDAFTSSYEEDAQLPLAAFERRLAGGGPVAFWGSFVGGELGGELVGVVGLERHPRRKIMHKATVVFMIVVAQRCGGGIATALLDRLVRVARRTASIEQLQLTVTTGNDRARRLYERAGFRPYCIEPRAVRVGDAYHDKTHMILFLT